MFVYARTAAFEVLEFKPKENDTPAAYKEHANELIAGLLDNGCYLCGASFLKEDLVTAAREAVRSITKHLLSSYDPVVDEFVDFEKDQWSVVRTPRINPGKHNIHFDPYESTEHHALAEMVRQAGLEELLTCYQQNLDKLNNINGDGVESVAGRTSLRESGLSLTAPQHLLNSTTTKRDDIENDRDTWSTFHNGMELHSDGPKGENTVLMSFDDVCFQQGPLLVAPGTHCDYIDGTGHSPRHVTAVERTVFSSSRCVVLAANGRRACHYCYRAGQPVVIDSRTLHGALPNVSNRWRIICWFIFEYIT